MSVAKKFVWGLLAAVAIALLIVSCSGSGTAPSPPPPPPPPGPPPAATITISNNAVNPQNVTVTQGTQVTFVNNDSQRHSMFSDPHPEHTDCIEINQVGTLQPGQSRQTGNLNTVRMCGFHDHDHPGTASLKGTITIVAR